MSIKKLLENSTIFFNSMKGLFIMAVSDSCDNSFCLMFQQIKCFVFMCLPNEPCLYGLHWYCVCFIQTIGDVLCVSRVDKIGVFSCVIELCTRSGQPVCK